MESQESAHGGFSPRGIHDSQRVQDASGRVASPCILGTLFELFYLELKIPANAPTITYELGEAGELGFWGASAGAGAWSGCGSGFLRAIHMAKAETRAINTTAIITKS